MVVNNAKSFFSFSPGYKIVRTFASIVAQFFCRLGKANNLLIIHFWTGFPPNALMWSGPMPQQPPMICAPEPPAEAMVASASPKLLSEELNGLGSLLPPIRAHSRPRIEKVRVKWEVSAHNQLTQGHVDKFSRFQPKLREHSFGFCL